MSETNDQGDKVWQAYRDRNLERLGINPEDLDDE